MGNLVYLVLAVGLSTLGAVVLWLARRRPRSMHHQMESFNRELRALRPLDSRATRSEAHLDRVEPTPIRPRTVNSSRGGGETAGPAAADHTDDRRRSAPGS